MNPPDPDTSPFARPYVVSWNLTYRCNLACEHCYLDAGGTPLVGTENFADRSELGTEECFRVIDEIAAFAPECLTILTGGEPLLRRDILEIVRRASERGLWVVVGTNGVRITENLARRLAEAGARGLSLSLDALDPDRHDRFRKVRGAWRNTVEGAEILQPDRAPLHRADDRGLAQSRRARRDRRLRARSPRRQGLEPLLPGADGARAVRVGHHPRAVRRGARLALPDPAEVRPPDAREREVRAALHQDRSGECRAQPMRQRSRTCPEIRTYSGGAGGCPAGTHYMGIRPNGDVTPCPYLPVFAGNLRSSSSRGPLDVLGAVRRHSPPHLARRAMRGVRDERPLRGLPRPGLRDDRRSDGRRSALHPHARARSPGRSSGASAWQARSIRRAGSAASSRRARGARLARSSTAPNRRRRSRGTMRPPRA